MHCIKPKFWGQPPTTPVLETGSALCAPILPPCRAAINQFYCKKNSNLAKKTQLQIIENLEQAPCLNGTKKTRNMSKLGHERVTYFHNKLLQQYIQVQESVIQLALKLTFGLNITNLQIFQLVDHDEDLSDNSEVGRCTSRLLRYWICNQTHPDPTIHICNNQQAKV